MSSIVCERASIGTPEPSADELSHAPSVAPQPRALEARPLIVADAGEAWLHEIFDSAQRNVALMDGPPEAFDRWIEYKRRAVFVTPGNWLALFDGDQPVGLSQGVSAARVFHCPFLYVKDPDPEIVALALAEVEALARRRRCHTISFEGPNTGALARALGPQSLIAAGYTWHERVELCRPLGPSEPPIAERPTGYSVGPLRVGREEVARLMLLESEAFLHAACDHPGEVPLDFSDGYGTSLIPMQATSVMAVDDAGIIRGALYADAHGRAARIHALFVEPECRNQGLGGLLLAHGLKTHHRAGFERTELSLLAANHPAIRVYERAGFEPIQRTDLFVKRLR